MTTFSIIVPCFNKAQFIERTLLSVCLQSYSNWECIVVDDGSRDNSCEVIKSLAQNDPRIKPIFKSNSGVADSRNVGLRAAIGQYVIFLDGDDIFSVDKLALTLSSFETNPSADIVYSDYNFLYSDGHVDKGNFRIKLDTKNVYLDLLSRWDEDLIVPIHCCCYRRDLLVCHNIEFDSSLKNKEDWDFILQVGLVSNAFYFLDYELVSYLVVEHSRSSVQSISMIEGTDQLYCKHYNIENLQTCKAIAYNLRYRIVRNRLIKLLGKKEPFIKSKFFNATKLKGMTFYSRIMIPKAIFRSIYKLLQKHN